MEQNQQQNEYALKKEQKEKETAIKQRKTKTKKAFRLLLWIIIILLIIFGIFKLSSNKSAAVPGEFFSAQSREHINPGDAHPSYNSNPPSGGWHYSAPAQTGIYDKELSDEQIIHNLEHGHIWFAYKPELASEQIEKLADIAKDYGLRIIMTPRSANDSPIAIVAWEHVYKLERVDDITEQQIHAFINAYRNIAGPERNIPDSGFGDFRGKTPSPTQTPMDNR